MKKTVFLTCISIYLLILFFASLPASAEENSIVNYEITARLSPSYEYLEVEAFAELDRIENSPELRVCKDFFSVTVKDLQVYDTSKRPLNFTFEENILKIDFSGIKETGNNKIFVTYKIYPLEKEKDNYAHFAFNVSPDDCHMNAAITRTDNWFPKLKDSGATRLPSFCLNIDVPKDFEVMASGRLYYISEGGERKVYKWKNYDGITDRSLYFFARKCKKIVKTYPDDFRVILYVPFDSIEENVDYVSDVIYKSYIYFEGKFGKTGLGEYKAMAVPYGYSGLFNSMTLGEEYFTREIINNDILFPTRNIVHEVSHTWWGNILAFDAGQDYWLFEGFAKFSEIIAIRTVFDTDAEEESFRRLKVFYMVYYGFDKPVQFASHIEERDLQVPVAYYKGALFLNNLKLIMGEESFFDAMKAYVETYRGKLVDTGDFSTIMQQFADRDLTGFFNTYLEETTMGEYRVNPADTFQDEKGNFVTGFKIENTGGKDIYTEIEVKTSLENYRKKIFIAKDGVFYLNVSGREPSLPGVLNMDCCGAYLLCESGLKGAGGYAYFDSDGTCLFAGIIKEGPLGKAGIENGTTLLEIDGIKCADMGIVELNRLFVKPKGYKSTLLVETAGGDVKEVEILY